MTTLLHEQRLSAVCRALRRSGATTVLDLGCGDGPLLTRLAHESNIHRIVGVDVSADALQRLQRILRETPPTIRRKVELIHGSLTEPSKTLTGFDAVVLVETIEHLDPNHLSVLERAVFRQLSPETVVITTPNSDFNTLLGVPHHRFRHPDHRFEWGRRRFRTWAGGIARRNSYDVMFEDVASAHPVHGGATQMALFKRQAAACRRDAA